LQHFTSIGFELLLLLLLLLLMQPFSSRLHDETSGHLNVDAIKSNSIFQIQLSLETQFLLPPPLAPY